MKNQASPLLLSNKLLLYFAAAILFISCQKKYLGPEVSYGIKFDLLQKMVLSSDAGVTTHTFTYNTANQVVSHNILLKGKNPARTENTASQFYRNGSGIVDSIKTIITVDGTVTAVRKAYFTYSSGNKLASSLILYNINDPSAERDSSFYEYNGNFLITRKDFVSLSGGAYSTNPYRILTFQYSGTNISNLILINTVAGSSEQKTTLVNYNYDTSKAALPLNGFQYGYDSVSFVWHEYAAINNLSNIKYGEGSGVGGASYEYNYLSNGKPFKATSTETNAKGEALVSKIEFFYD